jgi:hypothetical protein
VKDGIQGDNRVLRGGSWNNDATNLRSANRNNDDPWNRNTNNGFLLLCPQPGSPRIGQRARMDMAGRGNRSESRPVDAAM